MGVIRLVSRQASATLASARNTVGADGGHINTSGRPGGGPLRILHILNRLGVGGTELAVLKLIRGLSETHFEHRLGSLRGIEPTLEHVTLPGGKLLVAGEKTDGFQFSIFRLAKMMRAYRPHIVHSRNWGAIEAVPAALLARIPIVVHSEHGYELDMLAGLAKRRRIFRRAAYAMADAVVTVTRELRDYHARQAWLPLERIRVIYNGVDTQTFFPHPELRVSLRKRFCLPEQRFIVGTVGRMVPIKDHRTLLRAVEILTRRGIDAHALLVGAGPDLERNEQFVKDSPVLEGRVTFTGFSREIPALLNTLDAFVLPSICEGMSNTLLEAMATGLPLLATNVGGNTEVIEGEQIGWLFSPRDADALAARIALLASQENLRRDFGLAARARAVERFSLSRMLKDYSDLYLELAERREVSERLR
jgi:sugar transferase (PEP-CTERM/EpsH1 system associated)